MAHIGHSVWPTSLWNKAQVVRAGLNNLHSRSSALPKLGFSQGLNDVNFRFNNTHSSVTQAYGNFQSILYPYVRLYSARYFAHCLPSGLGLAPRSLIPSPFNPPTSHNSIPSYLIDNPEPIWPQPHPSIPSAHHYQHPPHIHYLEQM